jgi:redox-sensitive bicupin YhaK (pirin superfamily)
MVQRPNTLVADTGIVIPANDDVASCLATREVALHGPCVVSGVQSRHAEEIVFVRSGTVEVSDGNGNVYEGQESCISILRGQRYHLHVNAGQTAKLLILAVSPVEDPEKFSVLQIAKTKVRDMILREMLK